MIFSGRTSVHKTLYIDFSERYVLICEPLLYSNHFSVRHLVRTSVKTLVEFRGSYYALSLHPCESLILKNVKRLLRNRKGTELLKYPFLGMQFNALHLSAVTNSWVLFRISCVCLSLPKQNNPKGSFAAAGNSQKESCEICFSGTFKDDANGILVLSSIAQRNLCCQTSCITRMVQIIFSMLFERQWCKGLEVFPKIWSLHP